MSPSARADLSAFEDRIGYRFTEPDLVVTALTHISGAGGSGNSRLASYQRLEFLGDRVLGLVVSAMLFHKFPQAAEGELSRRLADLVRWESCAEVAEAWNVGTVLRLGAGELQSGGRGRPTILADVCEAIIGAVFLDGGFGAASTLVARAWEARMLSPRRALQDPKTALQEWAQGQGKPTPLYQEKERTGPDHAPRFVVAVTVRGHAIAEGLGTSKRGAEQAAAEAFMDREGFRPLPPPSAEGSGP